MYKLKNNKTMNRKTIYENANTIWHYLCQSSKEMSINDLRKISGLSIPDIYIAIGWLIRDNKIVFEKNEQKENCYMSQQFYF